MAGVAGGSSAGMASASPVLPSDTSSTDAFLTATKGFDWDNLD